MYKIDSEDGENFSACIDCWAQLVDQLAQLVEAVMAELTGPEDQPQLVDKADFANAYAHGQKLRQRKVTLYQYIN